MLFLESPDIPKPHTIWSTSLFWWLDYQVSVCAYAPAQNKAWECSFSIDFSETSDLSQTSSIWERELNHINWKPFMTLSLTPELHSVISEGPSGAHRSLVPSWTFTVFQFSEAHKTSLPLAANTVLCEKPYIYSRDARASKAALTRCQAGCSLFSPQGSKVLLPFPMK